MSNFWGNVLLFMCFMIALGMLGCQADAGQLYSINNLSLLKKRAER